MCLPSSPSPPQVAKVEPRRDMTYAYRDAGLERIKVPSEPKKRRDAPPATNKDAATVPNKVAAKKPKTPLNIG